MAETSTDMKMLPKEPIEEPGMKIHPFTIEKLNEENARYWFYAMESQLRFQFAWQAIQYYYEVGKERYDRIRNDHMKWMKLDMKADMIIQQGLNPTIILEIKDLPNVGMKWDYLKETYLMSSNAMKAMQLMKMASWHQGPNVNAKDAYREIEQLGCQLVDMNGSKKVDVDELVVIWYLHGLRKEYSMLKGTVMSSDTNLNKGYVLRQAIDFDQLNDGLVEKGSRVYHKKGMKCFVCGKIGHKARDCSSKRDDDSDDPGANNRKRLGSSGSQKGQKWKSNNRSRQKGRSAEDQEDVGDEFDKEYGIYGSEMNLGLDMTSEQAMRAGESHENLAKAASEGARLGEIEQAGYVSEHAHRVKEDPTRWCFDSGATSMSTGNKAIFEFLDRRRRGRLIIASGNQMPIEGRGIVKFNLPNGSTVRLGNVIYVPGLAENLLSLEALHMAGFQSQGSERGYELLKDGKVVAKGKRTGRTTYLDSVVHMDAIFTGPKLKIARQYARMALSADEKIRKKQELVHRRLGHPGRDRFNSCVESMDLDELKLVKKDQLLHDNCEVCIKAKQVKNQSHKPVPRARRPLQRVYMDFWGPNREGMGEEKYFLSLIDDCTRLSWIFIKADRKAESVLQTLDGWIRQVERQTGQMLLVIRTDNAKEFIALKPWAESKGIEIEFIEAETPPQNGVAERYNRVVLEITRALLVDSGINKKYWKYAVVTANYLRNRTILVSNSMDEEGGDQTPYELWHGHQPDLSHLRAWGCRVLYHHKPDSKLESRVMEGTFLMYGKSDKQYLVLPKGGSELKLVTNPEFRERERGYLDGQMNDMNGSTPSGVSLPTTARPPPEAPTQLPIEVPEMAQPTDRPTYRETDVRMSESTPRNNMVNEDSTGSKMDKAFKPSESEVQPEGEKRTEEVCEVTPPEAEEGKDTLAVAEEPEVPRPELVQEDRRHQPEPETERRSARIRQPSMRLIESQQTGGGGRKRKAEGEDDSTDRPAQRLRANLARLAVAPELLIGDHEYDIAHAAHEKAGIRIPKMYSEAVNDPIYGSKWKEAIHKELSALVSFRTWNVISRKDAEGTISSTRWVFDVKLGPDGRIDRFKARLVARGNEQSDDDFDETFAPVFRLDSLRILIAMAARFGMAAHMLDASNAFVGSELDKPNCMEIPEGLQDFDPETGTKGMVLELKKSLYGLRQSANLWHRKISQFLMKNGFQPITADPSVFTNNRGLIIALYVDDIVIFGKDLNEIDVVKRKLKEFHPMTDSGLVKKLLGVRFNWRKDGSIRLDQEFYARQILEEFGMADCNPVSSPISPSMQIHTSLEDSSRLGRQDHKLFRRLIGRLIFLVIATRPDIAFAVNQLSQYLAEPRRVHLAAVKHVLRYIKGTIDFGLTFGAKGSSQKGLIAYADSAYANSAKNRSTTGFIFMIDGTPIAWTSRKQSVTAQSSTEAEYMAVSEATKQAIWIRHFLYAIRKDSIYRDAPTTIYEDNQGAIKIADNPINHPKTKHIAVRYHAIRDHIGNGEIHLEHMPTSEMIADGLTKTTNHISQGRLVEALGLA
jgi:hypothetical protein